MALESSERAAASYDVWYDSPLGQVILAEELAAVRPLVRGLPRPCLEVGVGGGRFAAALRVEVGLDPAPSPLRLARARGIRVVCGCGEAMPLATGSVGAVLMVVTLCFVADALTVLRESRRVLRPDGGLVLGLILAESPWGQHYRALAQQGDPFYRHANFFMREALAAVLATSGLTSTRWRSALRWHPTAEPSAAGASEGYVAAAGFRALLAHRAPKELG